MRALSLYFLALLSLLLDFARSSSNSCSKGYRLLQVQVVHRHGDRTPITPLKDEEFWSSTLISPTWLDKISEGTKIIRRQDEKNTHAAKGRGPFGKLTQLGLFQMVNLGTGLREDLITEEAFNRELTTKDIRVISTDFPRTIQSVQGLLIGLFPERDLKETIEIDCRHTNWIIPDPQPRRHKEQEELEFELASRPHMLEREEEMLPLAVRCTEGLRHLLAPEAFDVSFGVDVTGKDDTEVLPWAQLAEITKCLKVREMLPEAISVEDQEALASHCAWRWFQSLRHPRLAYLSMQKFAHNICHTFKQQNEEPPLTIYSAHDSALIGLMAAFRLEQPKTWPEYGSYIKIALLEKTNSNNEVELVVRFYFNGDLIRSEWHGDLQEEITLQRLSHYISTEGAEKV